MTCQIRIAADGDEARDAIMIRIARRDHQQNDHHWNNADDASLPSLADIETGSTVELKRVSKCQPQTATQRQQDSLPRCNEKTLFRMRLCIARSSHFSRAKFILNFPSIGEQSLSQNLAMKLGLFFGDWKVT